MEYIDSNLQHNSQMVMCIEERDRPEPNNYSNIDTRLFIMWDGNIGKYIIFGKRINAVVFEGVPYVFYLDNSTEVQDFVRLVVNRRTCSMTWYNFNNLRQKDCSNISFEFFESSMDKNYEIIAYDGIKLNYKLLGKQVTQLRHSH